jgi:hypothetical protein
MLQLGGATVISWWLETVTVIENHRGAMGRERKKERERRVNGVENGESDTQREKGEWGREREKFFHVTVTPRQIVEMP